MALATLFLAVVPLSAIWLFLRRSRPPIAPGPGNSWRAQSASPQPWKAYKELAQRYGPIMCIRSSFGSHAFVLDSIEAIQELFEKRSKIFSSRPVWPMAELFGRQNNVGLMYYGERLKQARRVLHGGIGPQALQKWGPFFDYQSRKIVSDVLNEPNNLFDSVQRNIESMTVRFTYGFDVDDAFLNLARKVNHQTAVALQPGRWLVNYIPLLAYVPAWFPGAGFQKLAKEGKEMYFKLTKPPYERVKFEMDRGRAKPSFVSQSLDNLRNFPRLGLDEKSIISASGSVFSAAVDTTSSTILTFFLLIATHPEVQERAYQEIQSVVGTDRLPQLEDQASLPYVDAVIKEIFRFNPPVPVLTHSPIEEDIYNGYRIPKGSWVFGNVWSIFHNEEVYSEPERFIPERFLSETPPLDPRTFVFGSGRRICPGMHFANHLIFLTIARTIAVSQVSPPEGGSPPIEFTIGLITWPKPFSAVVSYRKGLQREVLVQFDSDHLKADYRKSTLSG